MKNNKIVNILKIAISTYLGKFANGVVLLVSIPLARESLSPELFGVWMALSGLLAFMGFADLGVGNAMLAKLIKATAIGNKKTLLRVLISGYSITTAIGALLLVSWSVWVSLSKTPTVIVGSILPLSEKEVIKALSLFVLLQAINLPMNLIQKIQLGVQQGYWNGVVQFVSGTITLCILLIFPQGSHSLLTLIMAILGVQTFVNSANTVIWFFKNKMFDFGVLPLNRSIRISVNLLKSGRVFFILQLGAALAFQSDAIVLTQTVGQVAYGEFATVQRLFMFVSMILNSAMLGLWPLIGNAVAKKEYYWIINHLKKILLITLLFAIFMASFLAISINEVLEYWVPGASKPGLGLVLALATWTIIDAVGNAHGAFMNGVGILRAQAQLAILMSTIAFAGKWLLVPLLGVEGVVVATISAYLLIHVPGLYYITRNWIVANSVKPNA